MNCTCFCSKTLTRWLWFACFYKVKLFILQPEIYDHQAGSSNQIKSKPTIEHVCVIPDSSACWAAAGERQQLIAWRFSRGEWFLSVDPCWLGPHFTWKVSTDDALISPGRFLLSGEVCFIMVFVCMLYLVLFLFFHTEFYTNVEIRQWWALLVDTEWRSPKSGRHLNDFDGENCAMCVFFVCLPDCGVKSFEKWTFSITGFVFFRLHGGFQTFPSTKLS